MKSVSGVSTSSSDEAPTQNNRGKAEVDLMLRNVPQQHCDDAEAMLEQSVGLDGPSAAATGADDVSSSQVTSGKHEVGKGLWTQQKQQQQQQRQQRSASDAHGLWQVNECPELLEAATACDCEQPEPQRRAAQG